MVMRHPILIAERSANERSGKPQMQPFSDAESVVLGISIGPGLSADPVIAANNRGLTLFSRW